MAKTDITEPFVRLDDQIEAKILGARRIFICDAIDQDSTREIIRKLWYLDLTNPEQPITIIINSPGGSVDAGFAIWDQVKLLKSPITTVVTGLAASMGSVLSLCASPGRCFATPNARIMIHQPLISSVIQGQATDLDIQAREMIKIREKLNEIYVQKTNKNSKDIDKAIDRDTWLSAEEAKEFGLIDKIISSFDEIR